jgi:hypothetical protein
MHSTRNAVKAISTARRVMDGQAQLDYYEETLGA